MRKPVFALCEQQKAPISLRSLISVFVVRCLDSIIPLVSISKLSSLLLGSVAAQTRFESTLVANLEDRFSRDKAHMQSVEGTQ